MQGNRKERVGHLIQMELSEQILHRVKDPRVGFVTITHVSVTPDLKSACVFVSVLGDEKKKKESLRGLEQASGFLQRQIGTNLKLKYTPHLHFKLDSSIDRGMEIDKILRDIKTDGPSPEP